MKLSEVRPFVKRLADDLLPDDSEAYPDVRRALAEAFMAGVRSQGLRYQKDSALWAACGCEPTTTPEQKAKKESK